MSARILLVEDEANLARVIRLNLELEGYRVTHAPTGEAARSAMREGCDLIVLDVMLPDTDGMSLCREMRLARDRTPVLMLTALGETSDRVAGLAAGADDYLPKPFVLAELLARIAALLRRAGWSDEANHDVATFGAARVDFTAHEATVHGEPLALTALEFELLRHFVAHPGVALSREALLEHVWAVSGQNTTRTVDNFVMRLRRHFEPDPQNPRHFLSVRGVGYKFVASPSSPPSPLSPLGPAARTQST